MVSVNNISFNNANYISNAIKAKNVSFKGCNSLQKPAPSYTDTIQEAFYTEPTIYIIGSMAETDAIDMKKDADTYLKISEIAKQKSEITYDKAKSAIDKAEMTLLKFRTTDDKTLHSSDGTESIWNKPYIRQFNDKKGTRTLITLTDDGRGIKSIEMSNDKNYEQRIINVKPEWNPEGISVSKGVRHLTDGTITTREEMHFDKDGKLSCAIKGHTIKKDKADPEKKTAHSDVVFEYGGNGNLIWAEKNCNDYSDGTSSIKIRYTYDPDGNLSLAERGLKITSETSSAKGTYRYKKNDEGENVLAEYIKNDKYNAETDETSYSRKLYFDLNGEGVTCEE